MDACAVAILYSFNHDKTIYFKLTEAAVNSVANNKIIFCFTTLSYHIFFPCLKA